METTTGLLSQQPAGLGLLQNDLPASSAATEGHGPGRRPQTLLPIPGGGCTAPCRCRWGRSPEASLLGAEMMSRPSVPTRQHPLRAHPGFLLLKGCQPEWPHFTSIPLLRSHVQVQSYPEVQRAGLSAGIRDMAAPDPGAGWPGEGQVSGAGCALAASEAEARRHHRASSAPGPDSVLARSCHGTRPDGAPASSARTERCPGACAHTQSRPRSPKEHGETSGASAEHTALPSYGPHPARRLEVSPRSPCGTSTLALATPALMLRVSSSSPDKTHCPQPAPRCPECVVHAHSDQQEDFVLISQCDSTCGWL